MQCPKCGYVRKAEDMAPEWQCPACQVVYAKALANSNLSDYPSSTVNQRQTQDQGSSSLPTLKIVVTLALVAFIGYGGYHLFGGITITRETSGNMISESPIVAPDKTVLLYSSSGCKYCKKAKDFLQAHNITYEEIDVYNSDRGKEDFAKLGGIGVPIMVVAGTKVVGFDEGELKSVLKSKGLWQ